MKWFFVIFPLVLFKELKATGENCNGNCQEEEECLGSPNNGSCDNNLICCVNGGKSMQKCEEYGQYVYQESSALTLMSKGSIKKEAECNIEAVPLIVGGLKAKAKEFPHMVAIGYGKKIDEVKWLCGGSLISDTFVLTAAHCTNSRNSGPARFARLGSLDVQNVIDTNPHNYQIAKRINHPKYKAPSRYHDIALLELSKPVEMSPSVRPACLHVDFNEFEYKKAVATGWGKANYHDTVGTPDLMKVTLDLIDYPICNKTFASDVGGKSLRSGIMNSQICAGHLKGGKDTCQGDSGGPLQIVRDSPYCMYSIIGVTSFGKFCGFKNSPAVYTRVSYYIPWIESIVWA